MKEAVLPFNRFPDADRVLGPEMRSTGEVMGIDRTFGLAFAKSQLAAGDRLPDGGHGVPVAGRPGQGGRRRAPPGTFVELGFAIAATAGTADHLEAHGVPVAPRSWPRSASEDDGADAVELIAAGKVDLVVNSPRGRGPRADGAHIRRAAGVHRRAAAHHRAPPALAAAERHGRLGRATSSRCARCRSTTPAHRRDDQLGCR